MKKYLVIIALCLPALLSAQQTYVPDNNFEQALIVLGLDTAPLNDSVPTKNIDTLAKLNVSFINIADLTGIADFIRLKTLICQGNKLTELDLRENVDLEWLACNNNNIAYVNLRNNTKLRFCYLYFNQLANLDISNNIALTFLACGYNWLSSLDASKNPALRSLHCDNNRLFELNVKNGNNKNMTAKDAMAFNSQSNPDLLCIVVDDSIASANNNSWHKDAQARYSELCDNSYIDTRQTYVPDDNFEQALIDLGYDTPPLNDSVPTKNIDTISLLNVSMNNITDLTGIKDFNALDSLFCHYNQLVSLDISHNSKLEFLACNNNELSSLNVSSNNKLRILRCYANNLNELVLDNNTSLNNLDCSFNRLTNLDVSECTTLEIFDCYANNLISINVSKNNDLLYLYCNNNKLNSLDISNCQNLKTLMTDGNRLARLDVSNNQALIKLYCNSNQITYLDVSNNPNLETLECSFNQLTELELSSCEALKYLECIFNQIYNVELSNCPKISTINCGINRISNLDLSSNARIDSLWCYSNDLLYLNIRNGHYEMFFDGRNNSDLFCILVDDSAFAATNTGWFKDEQAIYSEDCGYTGIEDTYKYETLFIQPNPATDYIEISIPPLERGLGGVSVKIYDVLGIEHPATVWHPSTEGNIRIDVSLLSPGVYFVSVGGRMFKFVKM